MLVLFILLQFKLHTNYDLRSSHENGGAQEVNQKEKQLNSNFRSINYDTWSCDQSYYNLKENFNTVINSKNKEALINCQNGKVTLIGNQLIGARTEEFNVFNHGLFFIKDSDFDCQKTKVQQSGAMSNKVNLIHFIGGGTHSISNTEFMWCGMNMHQNFNNNDLSNEFDPSLILCEGTSTNIISGTRFYNPKPVENSPQNIDLHPTRCIRVDGSCSLALDNSFFYNATAYNKGSFLSLNSDSDVQVSRSQFTICNDRKKESHAIFADESNGKVSISECTFVDCGGNKEMKGSVIQSYSQTFNFENNAVSFSDASICCRCLSIKREHGLLNILGNTFYDIHSNGAIQGTAVYIEKPNSVTINGNEFKNIVVGNKKVIYAELDTLNDKIISNNKFEHCPSQNGLIGLRSNNNIHLKANSDYSNVTFENMEFSNIHQNGGALVDIDNPNSVNYVLVFRSCTFKGNSNTNGGALLLNETTFPNANGLILERCTFENNHAQNGGALYITNGKEITFDNCAFNGNEATNGAGAIYIQPSNEANKCTFLTCTFTGNKGKESKCIYVNVPSTTQSSYADSYTLELSGCDFKNNYDENYAGGACCVSNCKETIVTGCTFINDELEKSSGGVNVTAKGTLKVSDCEFRRCNAGEIEGSFGGGIGYTGLVGKTSNRVEQIEIHDCTFESNTGKNGVAMLLNMVSMNADIHDIHILNHYRTKYIFCIFFNLEADDETFTLTNAYFIGNSYDNVNGDEYCGGTGIWIAEARPQDYLESLTVLFSNCHFNYNYAPGNGGAFGYETSERLKAVELEFDHCQFNHNRCQKQWGGACRFLTKKSVGLHYCEFKNNSALEDNENAGGGAIVFGTTVQSATIDHCEFEDCSASRGSFIFTQGPIRGYDIYQNSFKFTSNYQQQYNTVYLNVDSSAQNFRFEENDFIDLDCNGEYGGAGLHIVTGRDCIITSCTFRGNKGDGQIIVPESSNSKLIFKGCTFEQGTDGARAVFVKNDASVDFDTCTFQNYIKLQNSRNENLIVETGRGLLVYSLSQNRISTFENCTFKDIYGFSALDFENCVGIEFNNCNFSKVNCLLPSKNNLQSSNQGGLIFITRATHFTFTNSYMGESGSVDATNNAAIKLCDTVEVANIINSTFNKCGRYYNGGAISAPSVNEINVINCTFKQNMAQGTDGDTLSLYIGEGSQNCEISNCNIQLRDKPNTQKIYEIRVFSSNVKFIENKFDKEPGNLAGNAKGFGGVCFQLTKSLEIYNNIFRNTHNTAVYAHDVETISITNNTWDGCTCSAEYLGPRALYIQTTSDHLEFTNNTVKNCPNVFNEIMHLGSRGSLLIENCNFLYNECQGHGGGIGAIFNCGVNSTVTVQNCLFDQNIARINEAVFYTGFGGGFQFGGCHFEGASNTASLHVYSCTFIGNQAGRCGGALTFATQSENEIRDCIFTSNKGGINGEHHKQNKPKNGGAIAIVPIGISNVMEEAGGESATNTILNCTFESNFNNINGNADVYQAENGHSIFVYHKGHTVIEGCSLTNADANKPGALISYQRVSSWGASIGNVEIKETTFKCQNSYGCCAIEANENGCASIHNCTFTNLRANQGANAIGLLDLSGNDNEIFHNVFTNCGTNNYVVRCQGNGIVFHDNQINFDNPGSSCGYIEIAYTSSTANSKHHIYNTHFHDCKANGNGALHFLGQSNTGSPQLVIEDNTFERLKGTLCAFYIEAVNGIDVSMHDNYIQNNSPDNGHYICGFNLRGTYHNEDEFMIHDLHFINNTCSAPFGGGTGFWIQNKASSNSYQNLFTFVFENCIFENNHAVYYKNNDRNLLNGRGGAIQIGHTETTTTTSPTFIRCHFIQNQADNEGGALSIYVIGKVTIEGCIFSNNVAGVKPVEDGIAHNYGGAIMIDADFEDNAGGHWGNHYSELYRISNSTFNDNYAPDATAIYAYKATKTNVQIENDCKFIDNGKNLNEGVSNVIVVNSKNFNMEDSSISFSNPSQKSARGIKILGQALISNVNMLNVNCPDSATAIYIEDGADNVLIDNCEFKDCAYSPSVDSLATICIDTHLYTKVSNSIFNFTDQKAVNGIRIFRIGKVDLINNYITKARGIAALNYHSNIRGNAQHENINIEGNIFDNNNAVRACYCHPQTENFRFYNNTIQNMPNADYILQFQLNSLNNFRISSCKFVNLITHSQYGGGAGLWVQNSNSKLFNLFIESCTFENLYAQFSGNHAQMNSYNGQGGGLQFGVTKSTSNVNLAIEHCVFKGNSADRNGGALSLGVENDFKINNCTFIDNVAGLDSTNQYYGGAVYFDTSNPSITKPDIITFSHCTFRNNTAPNSDANAMHIINLPNTELYIDDETVFADNCISGQRTDKSAVIIDTKLLTVDSITFTHKNPQSSSRALEVFSQIFKVNNVLFQNITNGDPHKANAIWAHEKVLSCQIESSNFLDCGYFRGNVVHTETRDFLFINSTIKFTNCVAFSTKGIFAPYACKFYILDSSLIKCRFDQSGAYEYSHSGGAIEFHGDNAAKAGYTEEVRIEGTTFDGNSGNLPKATSSILLYQINKFPMLSNCTIKNSRAPTAGQESYSITIFFRMLPKEEFILDNFVFENNKFANLDGGGSGIWIAQFNPSQTVRETWPLTFRDCKFMNNHAQQSGGAVAYGNSQTLTFIALSFIDCKFIDNECEGKNDIPGGGALWINSQEIVTVSNCYFSGNRILESTTRATGRNLTGHAIYAAPNAFINVENCQFHDDGNGASLESIIHISCQEFNLTGSQISFTQAENGCRGVYIDFPGVVTIKNTKFINCGNTRNVAEGGGIYYNNKDPNSVLEEQLTIDGCTFDSCRADNGCAMLLRASVTPVLTNNKVLNQNTGKYVIAIFYTSFQDYCLVENMDFIGGSTNPNFEDGGGSAIWIANNREISNGRPAELVFRNCRWERNTSPKKGGALHYGNSQTLIGMELTFEDCHFINNQAVEAGGAVSLATISPSIFRNCEFNGNIVKSSSSSSKGSAIYIDAETPLCLVSGCTFTNSTADEGNAIFASTKVNALHITDNTRITNCGSTGSCVVIQSKEFFFLNSQISYDNINAAARGILVQTLSVIRISDSKFVKCRYTTNAPNDINRQGQGGAILIQRDKVETDNQEEVELLYTTFDSCRADNGCAIMFWITTNPIIRGNMIMNHNYNKYIFTIIRGTNFADQFTIENCTFMKNKFTNKEKQDGGGSAIWIANQQFFNEGELSRLIFKDCNWTKNIGVYGGAFSYGKSNTVKFIQLHFENCHFENNQASGDQGGALHLTTAVPVTITGCTFYNNKCVNNLQNFGGDQALGGALYLDTNATSVTIMNTTFRKNSAQNGNALFVSPITPLVELVDSHFLSNSNGNVGSQVAHQGLELRANNTNFDYQVVTLHSKGIDILSKSDTRFTYCNFTLCETPYDKGGAIFVQDQLNNDNPELLWLENCIFDNCNSSEGSAIYAILSSKPTIKKCTVKNNNQGCSIFVLTFTSTINIVEIDSCTFQNNGYLNSEEKPDGGGCGIWISNVNKVQFDNCNFIGNKADYVGGALAFGYDSQLADVSLQFDGCLFEDNTCNGNYGGALYLVNPKPILINSCTFRRNRPLGSGQLKGGDVYIDSTSTVSIDSSTFESTNVQISEGNAIYCSSKATKLTFRGNTFNNCGTSGTVAVSYAKDNTVSDSYFIFTEATNGKSARGLALYISGESVTEVINTEFTNCYFGSQDNNLGGAGLYVKCVEQGEILKSLTIDSCKFDGTAANNGAAMYLEVNAAPSLKSIRIKNCNSNNHIISINYVNQVEVTKIESCIFEYNTFSSSTDGGGAGIWITPTQKLEFTGCTFVENTATGNGGAFACYNSQSFKNTMIEFNGCNFNNNNARSSGGALYLITEQPISIIGCTFDGNSASSNAGAFYVDSKANIIIERTNIARNKATSKNAALYINNAQTLEFNNNSISDNQCSGSPASVEINNEGTANLNNNNFDFARQSDSQYQISLTGRSSSAICNFDMNCFTHKGGVDSNLVHILSTHSGQLNIPAGNCFDSGQYGSLQHNGGQTSIGDSIFECKKCGEIYIPTAAPEATPTATRQMTSKPTDIPVPTEKPYIPTPAPTPSIKPSEQTTTGGSVAPTITASESSSNAGGDSNKGKKKSVNIPMIAGIAAAVVVVIVVVIILLWLFVFRRRNNNNQNTFDTHTPETNNDTISGVSGANTAPQNDDPIWAGATATHDNPLFNGSEDQDDDHMNAGFEESWGENVI